MTIGAFCTVVIFGVIGARSWVHLTKQKGQFWKATRKTIKEVTAVYLCFFAVLTLVQGIVIFFRGESPIALILSLYGLIYCVLGMLLIVPCVSGVVFLIHSATTTPEKPTPIAMPELPEVPSNSVISFRDFDYPPDAEFITVAYLFEVGDFARLNPVNTADVFDITGPSGEITLPLGAHRRWNLLAPNMTTRVTFRPLSAA